MRALPMQTRNRPPLYAGHGTHGTPADGDGTGGDGVGAAQNVTAGKRNPPTLAEGGEKMTDAQLDAIKEAEDARIWEALNKEDPNAQAAVEFLRQAVQALEEAESYLQSAAELVEHTPETDRIASLNMTAEDLEVDIRMQIGRMK